MSLFGNKSFQKPAVPSLSQKSSFSPSGRLGMSKPAAPLQKSESKGFFGGGGDYRTFSQLKEFVKKTTNERLPGTGRVFDAKEKEKFVEELQQLGQAAGKPYSMSEQVWKENILPEMRKEEYRLHVAGKINEKMELQGKIQQMEKWIKGS